MTMAGKFLTPPEIRRVVSGHIPALDGLRGIAILLVLLHHFAWVPITMTGLPGVVLGFTRIGWVGVELFFVLSGFLITGILVDSKPAENYLSTFYIRRALRILPLYYGCVFIVFILLPSLGKAGIPNLPRQITSGQLWYWFYAGNWASFWNAGAYCFGHFWSLAVEEQFYLFWPWIVLMTSRRTLARVCILLILVGPAVRAFLHFRGVDPDLIYISTWCYLDTLALGSIAALIVRDELWTRLWIPQLNKLIYPSLLAFVLIGMVDRRYENDATFIFGLFPISLFFAGLVFRVVATTGSNSLLQRILQTGWLRSYGRYSYAIYVYHGIFWYRYGASLLPYLVGKFHNSPVRVWFYQRSAPAIAVLGALFILNILGMCLLMLGVGKLSWWAFEGPINNLKSRFKVRWNKPVTGVR
jgi:peptidoglycan/LPS O-acetylase OafA/YrhL